MNDHKSGGQSQGRGRLRRPDLRPRQPDDYCNSDYGIKFGIAHAGAPPEKSLPTDTGLVLRLKLDGQVVSILPGKLSDDDFANELYVKCKKIKKPILLSLDDLREHGDEDRFAILEFIAGLDDYRIEVNGKQHANLFEATLTMLVDDSVMSTFQSSKLAAMEAAILLYPAALEGACNRIAKHYRDIGMKGVRASDLLRDARKIQKALQSRPASDSSTDRPTIRGVLPEAPVGDTVVVPPGWQLTPEGVLRVTGGEGMTRPVILTGRSIDVHRDTQLVTLAWFGDGRWHEKIIDRDVVANSREAVKLAAYGLPVTSNNSRFFVQYLADFESANLATLPMSKVTQQMGWQGQSGNEVFLWGKRLITSQGVWDDASLSLTSPTGHGPEIVRFRGADEGDEQIARGLHVGGTMEKWLQAIEPIAHYPRVKLTFYDSFTPAVLNVLHAPNHILDLAGETTSGKTTVLRLAASVWGLPDEGSPNAAMSTWDSTAVWRERAPAVLNNLPFIIDDTKRARFKEEVGKTLYDVAQGRGRGRGSVKGLARQETWQTVMLTSGEQPVTAFSQDGGGKARVLELWGSPFGAVNQQIGEMVRKLNRRIIRNYGHAGPAFVQYLLQHRDQWQTWRSRYAQAIGIFEDWAGDNPVAGRMAAHFAAITMAARLAHWALPLPWDFSNPIQPLWDELVQEAAEADRATAALRYVMGVANARQKDFFGRGSELLQPHGGWLGRWDQQDSANPSTMKQTSLWKWIGFIPNKLSEILVAGGFEWEAVLRTWADRGWLIRTQEGAGVLRRQSKAKLGKESVWLVKIRREAVQAAGCE